MLKRATRARHFSAARGKTSDVLTSSTSDVEEGAVFPGRAENKDISDAVRGSQTKAHSELARKLLIAPHISEKATTLWYVFKVSDGANKNSLKHAIEDRYGVEVESVNIVAARDKKRRRGQNLGIKSGFKKAIIKLREGQTINEF